MLFWGWMDIALIAVLGAGYLRRGQVPLIHDLTTAAGTAELYGSPLPIVMTSVGVAGGLSLAASAYLLLRGRDAGRYIAFAQTPLRCTLIMPPSLVTLLSLILGTEVLKIWTLRRRWTNKLRRERAAFDQCGHCAVHTVDPAGKCVTQVITRGPSGLRSSTR